MIMQFTRRCSDTYKHTSKISYEETIFEWEFPEFFLENEIKSGTVIDSSTFYFGKRPWILKFHPKSITGVKVHLINEGFHHAEEIEWTISLKKVNGAIEKLHSNKNDFAAGGGHFMQISHAALMEQKHELVPSDGLTIICTLKRGMKCETSPNKSINDEAFQHSYVKVLRDGQNHDLILKVGDKEFPAHRDILRARSGVFESMLSHNMKEKNSGIIDIPDCDPKVMEQFLLYIYSGKVETLDKTNVFGLYYTADKYEMVALREECCEFIKKLMSVESICGIIEIALNHSDSSLLECATEYFCNNAERILKTVHWQSFLENNPTSANELIIKSIQKLKKNKGYNLITIE